MDNVLTIIAIVLGVVLLALIVLSLVGRKLQKKSDAAQENITAGAQYYSIMVIDKKRMKLSEAGFPQIIVDQTPKWLRGRKVPVVKAKIGPKIASLMCDEKVFDKVPVKKEVKAFMNGIYIVDVKGLRSGLDTKPEKKKFFARLRDKAQKVVDDSKKQAKATPGGVEPKKKKK
ncbi:MAG: hypothetical protein PUC73_03915 [Lachnospiraceae bacterium]|nr:hypothetical protein [Lachnospiraceae bacterium]